jgi:hypothetical protein
MTGGEARMRCRRRAQQTGEQQQCEQGTKQRAAMDESRAHAFNLRKSMHADKWCGARSFLVFSFSAFGRPYVASNRVLHRKKTATRFS